MLCFESREVDGLSSGAVVGAGVEEGRCAPHRSIFLNYLVLWLIYI